MLVTLRDLPNNQPDVADEIKLEMFEKIIPEATIRQILEKNDKVEKRRRKLPSVAVVSLVIGMSLYSAVSLAQVYRKLVQGLCFLQFLEQDDAAMSEILASKGGISQARYRLGVGPMAELFHTVCKPMTTAETEGAYLFGFRMKALDGTLEDVADTPENAKVFGRPSGGRGEGAYPQVRCVYLEEVGSHAIVDAGFWPYHTSERVGGLRLLRSVDADDIVLWDCGFHSFDMLVKAHKQRGAQVLARVPLHTRFKPLHHFADGSYLAYIYPSEPARRKAGEHLLVRIIDYTLDDPKLPGYGERHRLITTLLDPKLYPALDLVCAYHHRWEIEITIDEIDTHQRLVNSVLRSQKPLGVIQELYGLLLAHYLVRSFMHQAALQSNLPPLRLSFTHALRILCDSLPLFQLLPPERRHAFLRSLLRQIASLILPQRDHRSNPRVVKRKMSKFLKKRLPEHLSSKPSMPFRNSVHPLSSLSHFAFYLTLSPRIFSSSP